MSNHKNLDFPCEHGDNLRKLANETRHNKSNIFKVRFTDNPNETMAWGYDVENAMRKMAEGGPMSKENCHLTCCNMETTETIAFKEQYCPDPTWCKCWSQICDNVYAQHGHGRPTEEALEALERLLDETRI